MRPVLADACYSCHGSTKQKGGLRLDVKNAVLKGGDDGPVLLPGHSADSLLIHYVSGLDAEAEVPQRKGEPLWTEQVGILRTWIDQGANSPRSPGRRGGGATGTGEAADKSDHWAYKPLADPQVPGVPAVPGSVAPRLASSARNPVDAFVLAKLGRSSCPLRRRRTGARCCAGSRST